MKAEIKNVFEGQINEVSFRDQELYNAVFDVIRNLENKKTREGKKIKIENPIFFYDFLDYEEEFYGNDELKSERAEIFKKISEHFKDLLTKLL